MKKPTIPELRKMNREEKMFLKRITDKVVDLIREGKDVNMSFYPPEKNSPCKLIVVMQIGKRWMFWYVGQPHGNKPEDILTALEQL